ncbi:putative cyclin-related protein FAM58B, partial [Clarias magur]
TASFHQVSFSTFLGASLSHFLQALSLMSPFTHPNATLLLPSHSFSTSFHSALSHFLLTLFRSTQAFSLQGFPISQACTIFPNHFCLTLSLPFVPFRLPTMPSDTSHYAHVLLTLSLHDFPQHLISTSTFSFLDTFSCIPQHSTFSTSSQTEKNGHCKLDAFESEMKCYRTIVKIGMGTQR